MLSRSCLRYGWRALLEKDSSTRVSARFAAEEKGKYTVHVYLYDVNRRLGYITESIII